MNAAGFPLLSLLTWLPLVGAAVIMSVRGDEATVAANARWTALWTSLIVFLLSLMLWVRFDQADPGFPVRRNRRLAAAMGHRLQARRRRHFRAVRAARPPP